MAYDFAVDKDQIAKLQQTLVDTSSGVTTSISNIYGEIGTMNSNWSGEGYDCFKEGTEAYRPALEMLPDVVKAFSDKLTEIDSLATTCIDGAENAMNSMK